MNERRPGFFWPLGAPVFVAAGVLVLAVTLARTAPVLFWDYQGWEQTNSLFERFALDFTGPVAAAFGAYLSGRLTPPSRPYAMPRLSRDTVTYLAHALGPAGLVVTAGYLFALVPVVVQTFRTATWGTFDPLPAVSGTLVLNTLLVLGWLLGLVLQSALAAPLAFVLGYAATVIGYTTAALNFATPVIAEGGVAGSEVTGPFLALRISFFFLVLVVALLTARANLTTRGFNRRLPRPQHAALWLLPIALLVAGLARPLPSTVREADPPRTCRVESGIEFCVHQANEKAFDALIADATPMIELVGADNLGFDRVYDSSLSDGTFPPSDPRIFYVGVSPEWGVAGAGSTMAQQLSGTEVCVTRTDRTSTEQEFNAFMLFIRLQGDRQERPDNRFAVLSDDDLRQWLAEHRTRVNACDITDDLLP
jgi:hypothetical protein